MPGFISGANAVVKITTGDNKVHTLAYISDLSYSVSTVTVPVEGMGQYHVLTNEPVAYGIRGSFSVIRYTNLSKTAGLAAYGTSVAGSATTDSTPSNIGFGEHLSSPSILVSKSFDIDVYQITRDADPTKKEKSFFTIKDCRIQSRSAVLNKRNVLVDTYTFVAIKGSDVTISAV